MNDFFFFSCRNIKVQVFRAEILVTPEASKGAFYLCPIYFFSNRLEKSASLTMGGDLLFGHCPNEERDFFNEASLKDTFH